MTEEDDIQRGIDAHFGDLFSYDSNKQRLNHINRVANCVGNEASPIWREIRNYIEK